MPFIEAALAFDGNGLPVHKTDKVMVDWGAVVEKTTEPESIIEVEVYDIPTSNQIVLVSPQDGSLHVVPSGSVKVKVEESEAIQHFETDPINSQNEDPEMSRARLLSPFNDRLNQVADMLLSLMKEVKKAVMPLQFKVSRLKNTRVAADGKVMEGIIGCEVQVSDYMMKRKGTLSVEFVLTAGSVERPGFFMTSTGARYPWNEASFKEWLKIADRPYIGKRSPNAMIAGNMDRT